MILVDSVIIPKRERKSRSLTMVIEPSLLESLNMMANAQNVTRSEAARFILASYFDEHPQNLRVNEPTKQA